MNFLHSADWQIGKPFAGIDDPHKRAIVRQERIHAIDRLGEAADKIDAKFLVVAGDLFDSTTPEKSTVSAVCAAIGRIGRPVYVIPGNHDHGGPGSIWEQEFFRSEQAALAPNLHILLAAEPVELEDAVLFPCPLMRRQDGGDPTMWLRGLDFSQYGTKCRFVLAHGSTQEFTTQESSDEDGEEGGANRIFLERLPGAELDYIALGDWHGKKEAGTKAWYAGTPEPDRFPKGEDYAPGQVLSVKASRGNLPVVEALPSARLRWHGVEHQLTDDAAVASLEEKMVELIADRVDRDLVRMELTGSLSIGHFAHLEGLIERWRSRLLRLKLANRVRIAPSPEEMAGLLSRGADPLISRVAGRLIEQMDGGGEEGEIARVALRELHAQICEAP